MQIPEFEKSLLSKGVKTIRYHYTNEGYCPYCGEKFINPKGELLSFTCIKCNNNLTYYITIKSVEGYH